MNQTIPQMDRYFRQMLADRQREINSLVCVGLDPLSEKLPTQMRVSYPSDAGAIYESMLKVVDETAQYACMFKPQRAHWESIPGGIPAMRRLITHIRMEHQDIPIFLDCKRGDIDRTQAQYREAHFFLDMVHGMNYNGWMGSDTLKALVDLSHPERALVGLGRTSNPSAWKVQDRRLADGRYNWEAMVQDILNWSIEFGVLENAGVVMGAAHKDIEDGKKIYSTHLSKTREIVRDNLWFLIPGIGTQGGFIEETVGAAFVGPGSMTINSSSAIIFSDHPGEKACELRDQIRNAGGSCKKI